MVERYSNLTSLSFKHITVETGDEVKIEFSSVSPGNASWINFSDFAYIYQENMVKYIESQKKFYCTSYSNGVITVVHKPTGISTSISVTVNNEFINHSGDILFGSSSDEYDDRCGYGSLGSSTYVDAFFEKICADVNKPNNRTVLFSYKDSEASKYDFVNKEIFEITRPNIDDVDFMMFVGHGFNNKLHFTCGPNNTLHSVDVNNHDEYPLNFSTAEANFGYGNSRTKWVFTYSCNFLTTGGNGFVQTDENLYSMLNGAHMVLGFSSYAYLNKTMIEHFADYLLSGETIIEAYRLTSVVQQTIVDEASDDVDYDQYFKVIYALRAYNDTIYNYAKNVKGYSEGEQYGTMIFPVYAPTEE